jgi:L-amino acid N-acyltransferase YncA
MEKPTPKTNKILNFEIRLASIPNIIRVEIEIRIATTSQLRGAFCHGGSQTPTANDQAPDKARGRRVSSRFRLSCDSDQKEPHAMDIRTATLADVPDIQAIYAHHVLNGTGTFEEEPPSVEEMTARFQKVVDRGYVWLVACDASGVLGYGYYAPFRERSAYRFTVEDSIYVREDVRGQGVGKALVVKLIELATAAGLRQMIAVIGDSENVGSIGVHASLGFHMIGTMRSAGMKFGRWLDVVTMQRPLGKGDTNLPA